MFPRTVSNTSRISPGSRHFDFKSDSFFAVEEETTPPLNVKSLPLPF